ncbi:MAG: hypothetical protein WCF17_20160 [Terracidiphilus sp.]
MFIPAIFVLAVMETAAGIASAGTFSRSATTVPLMCDSGKCAAVAVHSPDGTEEIRRTFVRRSFTWDKYGLNKKMDLNIPHVEVVTPRGRWNLGLEDSTDWIDMDVLWSPDSKLVALTGEMASYIETVRVFAISETGPKQLDADMQPTQDMVRRLRPVCARYVGRLGCDPDQDEDGLNFAAVAWSDSHTLALMSEVPCDTMWGGIMCLAMGYDVDLPSGRIVGTTTPKAFMTRWKQSIPPSFRIPDSPDWNQ